MASDGDSTAAAARRTAQTELMTLQDSLIGEFQDLLPAGAVIRHVAIAREQLLTAGVRAGLATAVETMARSRLRALLPERSQPTAEARAATRSVVDGISPMEPELADRLRVLYERLRRLAVALALSEEMVADVLERAPRAGDPLQVARAREAAAQCRRFAETQASLLGTGVTQPRPAAVAYPDDPEAPVRAANEV